MNRDMPEHDEAVAAAREHLAAKPDPRRPLGTLPAGFADTVAGLHVVAEHLLQPKRRAEAGRGFLGFTPGGFGSLPWERGEISGEPGRVRVDGIELVSESGGNEIRLGLDDLEAAAEAVGVAADGPALSEAPAIDAASAAALADLNALATVVLGDLIAGGTVAEPDPIRLWPEHFDVATTVGSEAAGTRANVGASPGDGDHPEPYLYVGPWRDPPSDDGLWNARGFPGAELDHAELLAAPDAQAAATEFIRTRLAALES
jgi:hypothetical protein